MCHNLGICLKKHLHSHSHSHTQPMSSRIKYKVSLSTFEISVYRIKAKTSIIAWSIVTVNISILTEAHPTLISSE